MTEAEAARELVREATDEEARRHPEDRVGISERGLSNLETQFRLGAVHEDEATFVVVDDGELVGFASAWVTRGRATPGVAGQIDWCWARPGPARDELLRRLAGAVVTWLRDRGAGPIFKMEDASHARRRPWVDLGFVPDVVRFSLYQ